MMLLCDIGNCISLVFRMCCLSQHNPLDTYVLAVLILEDVQRLALDTVQNMLVLLLEVIVVLELWLVKLVVLLFVYLLLLLGILWG